MVTQNQVKRALRDALPHVAAVLAADVALSRTVVADRLCDGLGLLDARGRRQRGTCLKVLRELEQAGHLRLPAARGRRGQWHLPRRLDAAVAAPTGVPPRAELVRHLELIEVETDAHRRIWNELMIREHPLGGRPLVGRQVRYLLVSEHGYLGAAGFASCALFLHDRDRWIGWDRQARDAHLDRIVCMSRFLIRPSVDCANLASMALSLCCRAMAGDFERRYGYRPWLLESFVDSEQQRGTCYRAANWIRVGSTCGRGRQDRLNQAAVPQKDIYVYVLDRRFREYLGVPEPSRYPPETVEAGVAGSGWAAHEFGGAPLGDKRLEKRLISIAETKASAPAEPFLERVRGDRAATAGYYRFIDAPGDSQIDMASILAPHRERTLGRMNGRAEALCIHDTTDLNYSTLDACEGLGVIGRNQTKTKTAGLRLHTSFVVTPEEGLPLGILHAHCYAPKLKPKSKKKDPRYIPAERKETFRWISSLRECTALTAGLDGTHVIHVMDREGDFFELFDAWRDGRRDDLIVRAKHDRRTTGGTSLFKTVSGTEVKACLEVDIPRKSARRKNGRSAPQPPRLKRRAKLSIRYCRTSILPPEWGVSSGKEPVEAWLVHIKEESAPTDGSKAVEWFLLTTLEVDSPEAAEKVFRHYVKRWRIEEWHRALKTCCRAEDPVHRDTDRLDRVLAINMVVAWRIQLMTLLGREVPDLPAHILFSDDEIAVLGRFATVARRKPPQCLGDYVIVVAMLGGYLNRKGDGPPGAEVLSRGLTSLGHMCVGYLIFKNE